ncbi:MAG: hypothetical protein J6B71_05875 [Clostridia bacterium]|nr:hypothetical protein [Clostridia bacterium]
MLKSEKTHRAGSVFLWIGIIFAIVTLIAGLIHTTYYNWMPFELIFELPFEILLEYVLIGAGVTLIFLCIAWICYGVARSQARKETDLIFGEDDYCFEDEEYELEPVATKKSAGETVKAIKEKVITVAKDEKVQKVGMVVLPAVAACIVTAAIATAAQNSKKAKRRREFYRWLG